MKFKRFRASVLFATTLAIATDDMLAGENQWTQSGPPDRVVAVTDDAFPWWFSADANLRSVIILYAATPSGFWRSEDVGQTWDLLNTEMGAVRVRAIAADPFTVGRLTAVGCGAYQTSDGGTTWTSVSRGLPADCSLERVDIDVNRPGYFFASGSSGLFVTDFDVAGVFWRHTGSAYFRESTVIATAPRLSPYVFAAPTDGGFFVSSDHGMTWKRTSGGPPGAIVKDIQPQDDSRLTAVTDKGLFWTGDSGESWTPTSGGVSNPIIDSYLFSNWIAYATTQTGIVRGWVGDWKDFSDGLPAGTAFSRIEMDAGRHLCAIPESGPGTFVYRYGNPTIHLMPTSQALFVGENPALHLEVTPEQPQGVFLELETSDASVLGPFSTPYIIPLETSQPLPFFVRKASDGFVTIRVKVPQQFGGSETSAVVLVLNSVPQHLALDPDFIPPGGPSFTLRVYADNYGRAFVEGSAILWNGSPRTTSFVPVGVCPDICNLGIQATISAEDIAVPGLVKISVLNPPPGGGVSEHVTLLVGPRPRFVPVKPPASRPPVRVQKPRD